MAKTKKTAKTVKKTQSSQKKETKTSTKKLEFNFNNKVVLSFLISFFLILGAMWYAYDIRSGSVDLNGLEQRVEQSILQNVQQIVAQEVSSKYPNLNEQFLQEQIAKEMQVIIETREINLQGQNYNLDSLIAVQINNTKNVFQADNGQTYLTAIDPYLFLRQANNLATTGTIGDEIINGSSYVTKTLAPQRLYLIEEDSVVDFHPWLEAKLMENAGVTQDSTIGEKIAPIYTLSAIIAALSVIPIFIFTRLYTNNLIALFASLILVSIGTFVSRTVAGFVDTDAYQVLFSLAVVSSTLAAFKVKDKFQTILFGSLAGLFMGLFLWAWSNSWFIFIFTIISLLGYLVYILISEKRLDFKSNSNVFLTIGSFIISSIIFSFIFVKKNILSVAYGGLMGQLSGDIASIGKGDIWPNVFSSVAELNAASFAQIINSVGGEFVFVLAMLGIMFLSLDFKKERSDSRLATALILTLSTIWFIGIVSGGWFIALAANQKLLFLMLLFIPIALGLLLGLFEKNTSPKIFITMLLSIWMAGTLYMSLNGVRFILLLAPAFAISASFGLFYIAKYTNTFITNEFKVKNKFAKFVPGYVLVSILFLIIFLPMAAQAKLIGDNVTPNFDDQWYEAMYEIENRSNENAIITSWWDFGHFFTAVADRAVTFDGGSQTTPQAHWVGKLLLEDEPVAHDILRMVVCGGNLAFETINEISNDRTGGVHTNELIYSTFNKTKEEKIETLKNYKYYSFTDLDIENIMRYLHCETPRENYLITSGDMVGKGGVWAHWGSWDFTKKYVHDNYQSMTVGEISEILDKNQSEIQTLVSELQTIDIQANTQNINRENLINQWFAPYPSYAGNVQCVTQDSNIVCQNGLIIDGLTLKVNTSNLQAGLTINDVVVPGANNELTVVNNGVGNFDVVLVPRSQGSFEALFMGAPLGTSLFTKLFYLEGYGTSMFEKFHDTQTQTAGRVIVWKTLWDEKQLEVESLNYTIDQEDLLELIGNDSDINVSELI